MGRIIDFVGNGALWAVLALGAAAGLSGFVLGAAWAASAASLASLAVGLAALSQARQMRAGAEKFSSDMDALSRRLVRVEARLSEIERQPGADLRGSVAEVTGEIALLSGLVRDLATTVAGHDRAMAALTPRAAADPRPAPAPVRAAEPAHLPRVEPVAPRPAPVAAPEPAHRAPESEPAPASAAFEADAEVYVKRAAGRAPDGEDERTRAVLAAFQNDRLEINLQPIVSLPQRKTRFYEALARLRLGADEVLLPAEFMPVLERAGLTAELDGKVVARAAAVARHLAARGSDAFVQCNLSPAAMKTPGFLRALGRIFEAYPDVVGRLSLEISQRCWRTLDADAAGSLAHLRAAGLSFSLDRATDLRLDPLTLADRGVRYVKVPVAMLLRPQASHGLDYAMADLSAVLARAGIKLVAERVEREEDVPDLIELDVPLAQGFVFAPPRPVRAEVVGGPGARPPAPVRAHPAAPDAPASRPVEPAAAASAPRATGGAEATEQRLPFRSFLRRAG